MGCIVMIMAVNTKHSKPALKKEQLNENNLLVCVTMNEDFL